MFGKATVIGVLVLAACGGDDAASPDGGNADAGVDGVVIDGTPPTDAPACTAPTAPAAWQRRTDNPRLRAGATFSGLVDLTIADPDVHWDAARNQWRAYYLAAQAASFAESATQTIRELRGSPDGSTWTQIDPPALVASTDAAAWDHGNTETPTVVMNPDAPADRRYLMLYSGANSSVPGFGFPSYAIGAAFSPDGMSFTRVAAADSPHSEAGLVLTGADVYPGAAAAIVADPDVVYRDGTYHLWFSSFACATTSTTCDTVTAFGIGHATSTDGVHWTPATINPIPSLLRTPGLATSGGQQASVVWDPRHCQYELWMTSDLGGEHDVQPADFNNSMGVWRATSVDGDTWAVDFDGGRDLSWDGAAPGQPLGFMTGADVAIDGDRRLMLYVGFDDQQVPAGFYLPDRTKVGFRPGVMALGVATR